MQLHRDRDRFEAAGVDLAVIGQGTPAHARHFAESQNVSGLPLYVDRDREAYRAAGTKVGTLGELLGPRSVLRGLQRSVSDGVRQGRTVGHPAQLGGTLLVLPDGSIPWSHMSEDASDNASAEELLEAARKSR